MKSGERSLRAPMENIIAQSYLVGTAPSWLLAFAIGVGEGLAESGCSSEQLCWRSRGPCGPLEL